MAKEEKEEKSEEPALEVVTDETPAKTEKDDSDDEGGDDDSEDDSSGPSGGDERLGASDEEVADDTKRADRKIERKSRRQKQREKMEQRESENRFLREHNRRLESTSTEMAKRLDALEGNTLDGRIAQFNAAISKADDTIADAVTNKDGAAHKEATQIRDQLIENKRKLEQHKEQQSQQAKRREQTNEVDPDIARLATSWAQRNEWFDPNRGDEDSTIAAAIDYALSRDRRFDARTPEYYKEFDRRLKARGVGPKARARDDDRDDADLETEDPPRKDPSTKNGKANGGPKFRGGGGDRQLGPNQVYLNKARLDALEAAGIEPGTDQYKRMLKRYKAHDDAATNDTAR